MDEQEERTLLDLMAQKWDRVVMMGATPLLFVVCVEDLPQLQELSREAPDLSDVEPLTFRHTPVLGLEESSIVEKEGILIVRATPEEIEQVTARASGYQVGVLHRGGVWLIGTPPRTVERSD